MFATARHTLARGARLDAMRHAQRALSHPRPRFRPREPRPAACSPRSTRRPLLLAGGCAGLLVLSHSSAEPVGLEGIVHTRDEWPDLQTRLRVGGEALLQRLQRASGSEAERPVLEIAAVNVAVFALWRVAPAEFMTRHFTCCVRGLRTMRAWTLLTANFSHVGALHLCANMLALGVLAPPLVGEVLGEQRFREMYAVAGVSSMSASAVWKFAVGSPLPTLGASGCVCAVLAAWAVLAPHAEFRILDVQLTARELALFYAAVDAVFALAMRGRVAFAAHVGGAGAALAYCVHVREDVERERRERGRWALFTKRGSDRPRTLWQEVWTKISARDRE